MPGGEDRLRAELERLARLAKPEGAFEAVVAKKARRRLIHRAQVAGLVVTVVAGTAAGSYGLAQVFRAGKGLSPAASLSANGRIAFVAQGKTNPQDQSIFTMNPNGSDVRVLTPTGWLASEPAWSPDGTRIAFRAAKFVTDPTSGAIHPSASQLFVMNADGSGRRLLAEDPAAWSWNGTVLVFRDPALGAPVWSPDGTRIAFASERDEPDPLHCGQCNSEIYVVNVDGTGLVRLTHDSAAESSPDWSPDGSRIAFVKSAGPSVLYAPSGQAPRPSRTYVMNVDGSGAHPLLHCTLDPCPDGLSPRWSPDGQSIAFFFFYRTWPGRPGVFVSDANGDHLRFFRSCAGGCIVPSSGDWSPDGTLFLFEGETNGFLGHTIWTMRTDGSGISQLRPPIASDPAWQPVLGGASQTPIPTATRTPIETPSETPSQTPSETPSMSPTPTSSGEPPFLGFACGSSSVSADFDGDGTLDTLMVYPSGSTLYQTPIPSPCPSPASGPFTVAVAWGSGGTESSTFDECVQGCAAYAAQDLDGNGTAEVALIVDQGASTQFVYLYEIPNDHRGRILFKVGPPGTNKYKGFDPLKLAFGGSVTHQDFITCRTGQNGGPQLIATSAVLSADQTTWNLSETVFDYNGQAFPNDVPPRSAKAFTVTSTRDYTEPFDPNGNPPTVAGDPCFVPG